MSQKSLVAPTQAEILNALILAGVAVVNEGTPTYPFGISVSWVPPLSGADAVCVLLLDDAVIPVKEQTRIWDALSTKLSFTDPVRIFSGQNQADVIPQQVTMRQARLALLGAGKLAAVTAAINSLPEPQKSAAQITWDYSSVVQRNNGLVPQMATALGMTSKQIDDLFIAAASIN